MKRFLIFCLLQAMLLFSAASAYIAKTNGVTGAFWAHITIAGQPANVDFSVPPPNYDPDTDLDYDRRSIIGYDYEWQMYLYENSDTLAWNGISFDINEEAPNYTPWHGANTLYAWDLYFSEMYYDGGADNPLADEKYDAFWKELRYHGEPVDPYSMPPNYERDLDYYADVRPQIGYHWYWEYYFGSQHNYLTGEAADLEWNGIGFDVTVPPEQSRQDDPFINNRIQRGFMQYWADYFLDGKAE